MFNHAIVRTPCPKVCDGITSAPELGQPIYEKALEQHAKYIEALKATGVDVMVLPALEDYPDSCFVEDVAKGIYSAKDDRKKAVQRIHKYVYNQSTTRGVDFLVPDQ